MVSTLFGFSLIVLSVTMLCRHSVNCRDAQASAENDSHLHHVSRQFRRRAQASGLLGIVGIAVAVEQHIPVSPLALLYWFVVVLVVLWIIVLALMDLVGTRRHLDQIRRDTLVERALLREEIRQLRQSTGASVSKREDE